jgi:redox-sensitive bicupin YhaK (pirin superfamily)
MYRNPIINSKPLGFQWEPEDPFLFTVHHLDFYPKAKESMQPDASLEGRDIGQDFAGKDGWRMYHGNKIPGFPGHPHRGFETVTIVRQGFVDHSDSMGATCRYSAGDVQWLTAGKGIQHSEMFPLLNTEDVNTLELFQIWLNLPQANKFVEPHFKMLWNKSIPVYDYEDSNHKKTQITVVAGEIDKCKAPPPPPNSWAADAKNAVAIWTIKMEAEATWNLPATEKNINRTLYFFKGSSLKIENEKIASYTGVKVHSDMEIKLTNGNDETEILLLQGRPIKEPVMQYGPFVMNTRAEIEQAFRDYQMTQFGGWPWNTNDPVHPRTKGRFAIHADGSIE